MNKSSFHLHLYPKWSAETTPFIKVSSSLWAKNAAKSLLIKLAQIQRLSF